LQDYRENSLGYLLGQWERTQKKRVDKVEFYKRKRAMKFTVIGTALSLMLLSAPVWAQSLTPAHGWVPSNGPAATALKGEPASLIAKAGRPTSDLPPSDLQRVSSAQ
jgi:hypothetical protein